MMTAERYGWRAVLALGGMLILCYAISPASAGELEDKIRALEDVQRANAVELERLKGEQIELKKEATAAAAVLPSFEYRPGSGLRITAADKSWMWRFGYRWYMYVYNNTDGNDARGATTLDPFNRRNRPQWTLCWEDCFYETEISFDFDTGDIASSQTSAFYVHFENLNPYFPTFGVYDKGGAPAGFVARSSSSSAAVEYVRDLMIDSGVDTLSHRGFGLLWDRAPLGNIGTYTFVVGYVPGAGFNQNRTDVSDRAQIEVVLGARPFSKTKNKWIRQLKLGVNLKADSIDTRASNSQGNRFNRIRLRETNRIPRVTVWEARDIGDGQHAYWHPGLEWGVGPYLIRANGVISRWEGKDDGKRGVRGTAWGVAHELYLWSPKGFLTGSRSTAGSILVGYRFARADGDCGVRGCARDGLAPKAHYIENEWDVWYFVRRAISVGVWVVNSRASEASSETRETVGCPMISSSCKWTSVNFGVRTDW